MPKEWILNQANMRWGLTRKSKVGPVADMIRKCSPKDLGEWEEYYHKNGYSKEHLIQLGRILFVKISEICKSEIESITEQDCIDFVIDLVIKRTFDGYRSERDTIYGQLESILGVKIEPASDDWDRRYNVDFFIRVDGKHIGLQIKPAGYAYIPQIIKEIQLQKRTHEKFTERFGGKVFYVISVAEGKQKIIQNKEVIEEIRREISRLRNK